MAYIAVILIAIVVFREKERNALLAKIAESLEIIASRENQKHEREVGKSAF